jgi:hypothetical protein
LYLAAVLFGLFLLCSPRAAEARFWYSGEVTSAETVNDGKIEVNGIMFTFMPRAKVERQYEIGNGVFRNRRMAPGRILKGNTVRMLVEGHRIHRFVRVK